MHKTIKGIAGEIHGKCRVALVGAGNMAKEHIRAFCDIQEVLLAGIYSRTKDKALALAEEFAIEIVADSLEELYKRTHADIVVITVNAPQMGAMVMQCCRFPWTILAEKPVGMSVDESEAILDYARKNHAKVFVALNRRFYESTRILLNELAAASNPRFIDIRDQQEPWKLRAMGKPEAEVDGLMYANSIHLIDYFCLLGRGEILSVEPILPWKGGQEASFVAAVIQFSSGDTGFYQCCWNMPGPWSVAVSTPEKRFELRPLESLTVQVKNSRIPQQIELSAADAVFKPGLRVQAMEAVKAAVGLPSTATPLAEAHKAMLLIASIYKI